MQPDHIRLRIAALMGFLAVALGAMGAHGAVHDKLQAAGELAHWQTGVSYHLPHSILLVILALVGNSGGKLASWSWRCLLGGILLFSGSLYIMAYFQPKTWAAQWLAGAVFGATPLGGLLLMTGWLLIVLSHWRRPS
ncbi:MAG: DUF423 domain-containing protein [Prosthecobacter sp.]|nr:DUF423 domain-containing protein [Prosthecobacter sp.]